MEDGRGMVFARGKNLVLVAAVVGLFVLPHFVSRFTVYLTLQILLLSMFALSFNLLFGYTGLLSFGHAAFYAAGAYATGLILKHGMPSLLPGVLGGTAIAAILALGIGYLCVRHTEIYFSMLTLAFGMMIYALVWKWSAVTGGDDGLVGIPRPPLEIPGILRVELPAMEQYYYVVLVATLVTIYLLYRLVRSPFGLVLQGIRENESRAHFAGIGVGRYRLVAFVISGTVAGLAGSLLAPLENTVAPDVAHWTKSAEPVLVTLIGGAHTFGGPILGSVIFLVVKETIVRYTEYWLIWFGIIMVIMVLGFRGGVVGYLLSRLRAEKPLMEEP